MIAEIEYMDFSSVMRHYEIPCYYILTTRCLPVGNGS